VVQALRCELRPLVTSVRRRGDQAVMDLLGLKPRLVQILARWLTPAAPVVPVKPHHPRVGRPPGGAIREETVDAFLEDPIRRGRLAMSRPASRCEPVPSNGVLRSGGAGPAPLPKPQIGGGTRPRASSKRVWIHPQCFSQGGRCCPPAPGHPYSPGVYLQSSCLGGIRCSERSGV
jgi:hypothetical protein